MARITAKINKIKKGLGPQYDTQVLPRDTLHFILVQLRALRQASTHYQVVSSSPLVH